MDGNHQTAVFTLVNNQPEFQEIWTKYYSQFPFRLVILEHHLKGEDELVFEGPVGNALLEHHIVVRNKLFDHTWMCNLTGQVQRLLLQEQPTVIYTDIDELIVPKDCSLEEYCENNQKDVVRCKGYEMYTKKHVFHNPKFNKPVVGRIPITWTMGWHDCAQGGQVDEDLWLLHLHRMDYNIAKKHWLARQKLKWDAEAERLNLSRQNHFAEEVEFAEWFHQEENLEPVPDWLVDKLSGMIF